MDARPEQLTLFDPDAPPPPDATRAVRHELAEGIDARRLAALSHTEIAALTLRFGSSPHSLAATATALGDLGRADVRALERRAVHTLAAHREARAA